MPSSPLLALRAKMTSTLSGLSPWLSDALRRLTTGGSFAVRRLYTDDEEALFQAARPVLLNGIEDVISRGWARSPRALTGRLRRVQPSLRSLGIDIVFNRQDREGATSTDVLNAPSALSVL
jgi:hypothetical protein